MSEPVLASAWCDSTLEGKRQAEATTGYPELLEMTSEGRMHLRWQVRSGVA